MSKHVPDSVWLTVFASLGDTSTLLGAVNPHLAAVPTHQDFISDLAREELLQAHCDSFRAAIDLVTSVALDVHNQPDLPNHQKALVTIGIAGRASRVLLELYLAPRSPTLIGLADPEEFWSILGCTCLTGQQTDAVHWLYNIVLGFDSEWRLGEDAILARLGI